MNKTSVKKLYTLLSPFLFLTLLTCKDENFKGNVPNKVFLTEIIVTDFPDTTSQGSPWDLNSTPDISIFIEYEANGVVETIVQTDTILNPIHDTTYTLVLSPPVELPDPEAFYSINIHDIDTNFLEYDFMLTRYYRRFFVLFPGSHFYTDTIISNSWNMQPNGFKLKFNVLYEY